MRSAFVIVMVMGILVTGCRSPEGKMQWPGELRVGMEPTTHLRPDVLRHATEALPAREQDQELVREIAARHEQIFRTDPPQQVLDESELIFFATGRLPELLSYYEDAIARRGDESALLARIGWLYERLGIEDLAFDRVRDAAHRLPDDPFAQFALAYTYGQQSERREDPYGTMIHALARVFELSPDFEVRGVVNHQTLREEYTRIQRQHGDAGELPETDNTPTP